MQEYDCYLDMFRRRIHIGQVMFGEITPSHATLGLDGFRAIRRMHDNVKVVFILRDPVARLILACVMESACKAKMQRQRMS